ncbi:MAG: cell division protein ZipA C-terminal FtsZ-binding domain-containing protein [Hydrogenophilaceae bacterium]
MTSLHYTLIALGIGLVGAVMLYNLWQERRSRKQAERIFRPHERDEDMLLGDLPLHDTMPDPRIEPKIHLLDEDEEESPPAPVPFEPVATEPRPAPVEPPAASPSVAPTDDTAPPASQGAQTLAPESPLDGEIEFIARLRYAQPAVVQFASLQDNLRRISKPIRMVGRREDGTWEPVAGHAARPYGTVELALLLADRAGPVSDAQLDAFCRRLYEFATDHGGAISCQDKAAAVEQAKMLDAFCAEVDVVIGLNVLPAESGFPSQDVGDLAAQAGLVQAIDGTYSLRDDDGQLLFTLNDGAGAEEESAHGIALLFDVPRVGHGLAAFDRMTELGLKLAERLGGRLVDDGGRPVSRASLERDRKSLETIYARMAARGIPAGGERALRLFA